jgi:hypothetical protein
MDVSPSTNIVHRPRLLGKGVSDLLSGFAFLSLIQLPALVHRLCIKCASRVLIGLSSGGWAFVGMRMQAAPYEVPHGPLSLSPFFFIACRTTTC